MAPLSRWGPGTSTMQGQTATRRSCELRWYRTARAPTTPAKRAAQKGWMNRFVLRAANTRRTMAPMAALKTIKPTAARCETPKITARAAAPAAAASVNSQVAAGGAFPILRIVDARSTELIRPAFISVSAFIAAATRCMSIPAGFAATCDARTSLWAATSSWSSPHRGRTAALSPQVFASCPAAATVCSVDCPLTYSTRANARMSSPCCRNVMSFSASSSDHVAFAWIRLAPAGSTPYCSGRQAAADFPGAAVATYGRTILAGSTMRSNSASVTKPNFKAAAFNVRSLSIA